MSYTNICFENTLAVITEEPLGTYVSVRWQQADWDLAEAKQVMNALLDCLHHTGWRKVLIKQPPLLEFPLAYHTWLLYEWIPRARALGEVAYAIIPPQNLFAHIGFADFLSQLRRFGIHYFNATSQEYALAWLNQQTPSAPGSKHE